MIGILFFIANITIFGFLGFIVGIVFEWKSKKYEILRSEKRLLFYIVGVILWFFIIDLLRKYPEDLQFPNEIRKPNPKKRQRIQTAHRCNARPFSRNAANHHRSRKPEGQVRQAAYAQLGRPTAAYPKLSAPLPYPTRIGRHLRPFRK